MDHIDREDAVARRTRTRLSAPLRLPADLEQIVDVRGPCRGKILPLHVPGSVRGALHCET